MKTRTLYQCPNCKEESLMLIEWRNLAFCADCLTRQMDYLLTENDQLKKDNRRLTNEKAEQVIEFAKNQNDLVVAFTEGKNPNDDK